jgi:L-asparaginase II
MAIDGPVLVEIIRGNLVENAYRGAFAVVDARGMVVASAGDIDGPVFPRSAIKPLQALPLIESGAAAALGLGPEEIALACASHGGEAMHVDRVSAWLARAGLGPDDLECGVQLPYSAPAAADLIRRSQAPCTLHHNCSGKHTGFVATARHLGEPTGGYVAADHPVQRRVLAAVSAMTGLDLARAPRGIDGCSIPVVALSLAGMARGMARLVDRDGLHDERRAAATQIIGSMLAAPELLDDSQGMTPAVIRACSGSVVMKLGAEGVFNAALPGLGLGIALKIADGAAKPAALAIMTLLDRLGLFDETRRTSLATYLAPPILSAAGREVGALRPTTAFDAVPRQIW